MSAVYKDDQEDWLTVCLKYLLFVFNFLFWVSENSPLFKLLLTVVIPIFSQCGAQTALNKL